MPTLRFFPPSTAVIVLTQLIATAVMTGVIWYVQIVHYPLMAGWPHDQFSVWEARHRGLTATIVIPGMAIETLAAAGLLLVPPRHRNAGWLIGFGMLLLAGIWASTFLLQMPCHTLLSMGWDEKIHARLVETNWLRTGLWTARLVLAAALVIPLLADEPRQPSAG